MSTVAVRDLWRTHPGRPPVEALRGATLDADAGSLVAVLGPSGCGKTTLLRCIAGLERPDRGEIEIGGTTVSGARPVPPERRRVGLVPQEGALFPHLDVGQNVAFGLRGQPRSDRRARVEEMLDLVGLPGMADRLPHQLSGGQQQRVAVARALAPEPVAVLLDEPFSALDASLRTDVREEVAATLRRRGVTTVLVTHDQTEALSLADRVAVMRDGRIVQVGSPEEVYRRPADLWTARFLGEVALLPGAPSGRVLACRPEQLRRADPDEPGARDATVVEVRFRGPDAQVVLRLGDGEVTARWASTDLPAAGDLVHVVVSGGVLDLPAEATSSD